MNNIELHKTNWRGNINSYSESFNSEYEFMLPLQVVEFDFITRMFVSYKVLTDQSFNKD
jgi:hypothetical protein